MQTEDMETSDFSKNVLPSWSREDGGALGGSPPFTVRADTNVQNFDLTPDWQGTGAGGPPLSSPSAPLPLLTDAVWADEQMAAWEKLTPEDWQELLSKAGDLTPSPEQSARIWERLVTRLGWRR